MSIGRQGQRCIRESADASAAKAKKAEEEKEAEEEAKKAEAEEEEEALKGCACKRTHAHTRVHTRTHMHPRTHPSGSHTHLRAHETPELLVCRLLLEKKKTSSII